MSAGIKYIFVMNIDMNQLPEMERWYLRYHAPEAIYQLGAWFTKYQSYRAVPPMYGAEEYGYYNYRVSELCFRSPTDLPRPILTPGRNAILSLTWPESWKQQLGTTEVYDNRWPGRPEGPHPFALQCFIPAEPTDDFMGGEVTADEKTILRWLVAFKYPDSVPVEEGEDWYLNVHSKEVMKQPGLTRYFSYRTVEVPGLISQYPWHRVTEMWYENFKGWRKSIINSPPSYTKPPWVSYDKYPFLEPYSDFVSTFLLERPTDDFLRDVRSYP